MQEQLELEELLAVIIKLLHYKGQPSSVPGSRVWSSSPLATIISHLAAPEPRKVDGEELLEIWLHSPVKWPMVRMIHYQTNYLTPHYLPHPHCWYLLYLTIGEDPSKATVHDHPYQSQCIHAKKYRTAYNLLTLESISQSQTFDECVMYGPAKIAPRYMYLP